MPEPMRQFKVNLPSRMDDAMRRWAEMEGETAQHVVRRLIFKHLGGIYLENVPAEVLRAIKQDELARQQSARKQVIESTLPPMPTECPNPQCDSNGDEQQRMWASAQLSGSDLIVGDRESWRCQVCGTAGP